MTDEQSGAGTEHVGPIVFSDSTARGQLLNHGQAVTFRTGERTTGDTWWRKSRTGEKMGDCHVRQIGHVDPSEAEHLRVFRPHSGFRSIESWQEAIERLNGGQMPDDGVLYHVEAVEGECGKCGEAAYLPTNTFCPACHREEAARADGSGMTLAERIFDFNSEFDYGELHDDPEFWMAMLRHQVDEAEEAYADGDEEHMVKEAADAVLVAFQFMRSCGSAPPHHYVHERMQNARDRGIQSEIVPKYREWYQAEQAGDSR